MLNWIQRRAAERRRLIFRYWDGSRQRRADPLAVYRALDQHADFDWSTHPRLAVMKDSECLSAMMVEGRYEAVEITTRAVREVFGIPEFDDAAGLTQAELLFLLDDFTTYVEEVKKKLGLSRTSPQPTDPQCSDESTTLPGSDCGSVLIENCPETACA